MVSLLAGCSSQEESPIEETAEEITMGQEETEMETEIETENEREQQVSEDGTTDTMITITSGTTVITATLNDSQTTKEFIEMLPLTIGMTRFYDREYAGGLGQALSEEGEELADFSNGDVTYYTAGQSLAIFLHRKKTRINPI